MADVKIPLRLVTEIDQVRAYRDGREVYLPQRREIQNDAACLYQILDTVDTGQEKYQSQRRRIRRLRRDLRPLVREADKQTGDFDGVVGDIEVSDDALKFIVELFDKPPEGVAIRGAAIDTAEDLRDFYDELKRENQPEK